MRNIVSMLGGTIRLDSKKGKGSRFTVEISMQEAEVSDYTFFMYMNNY